MSGSTLSRNLPVDADWAEMWRKIVAIFDTIDHLENQFLDMDVSYLREVQQKQLILNLRRYAWSLQNLIIQRYGKEIEV